LRTIYIVVVGLAPAGAAGRPIDFNPRGTAQVRGVPGEKQGALVEFELADV